MLSFTAITSIALTISINIVVNVSDLVNEKSSEYQKWNESVTNSVSQALQALTLDKLINLFSKVYKIIYLRAIP